MYFVRPVLLSPDLSGFTYGAEPCRVCNRLLCRLSSDALIALASSGSLAAAAALFAREHEGARCADLPIGTYRS